MTLINTTLKQSKLVEKELSFKITGIGFKVQNELGRFLTEKHYSDAFETRLKDAGIAYEKELTIYYEKNGTKLLIGRPDFIIESRIIVDLKAKKFITKEDYNQMLKYLKLTEKELGLIINFRSPHLKPKRVLNADLHSDNSGAN